MLEVNTYLLYNDSNEAIVIDCACFYQQERNQLKDFITDHKLSLKYVLNSHLHFDHVFGNQFLLDQYGIGPMAHTDDEFLNDSSFARMMGIQLNDPLAKISTYLTDKQILTWAGHELMVLHVPGHSPGGLAFYCESEKCLFSGDTLFNQSIGRSDLPGGNHKQLLESIKTKLMVLPDEVVVYPGHGLPTTIGEERKSNPFL